MCEFMDCPLRTAKQEMPETHFILFTPGFSRVTKERNNQKPFKRFPINFPLGAPG
jgi:hypothetical protein